MGLIAKSRTKKRIAAAQASAHGSLVGSPWLTTGGLASGALVRSAAMSLDLVDSTSNTVRGRQSILSSAVIGAMTQQSSSLWVETEDFQQWSLVLGVMALNGTVAADWVVHASVAAPTVTVTTSHWLINDDELVNGEQHDALRQSLLAALTNGALARVDAEAEVTRASLTLPQPFSGPPPEPCEVSFVIRTTVAEAERIPALALMGAPKLEVGLTTVSWGLGLHASDGEDLLKLTLAPQGLVGIGVIGSISPIARRVAGQALRSLIARTIFLLDRRGGGAASYQGPAEWEPER